MLNEVYLEVNQEAALHLMGMFGLYGSEDVDVKLADVHENGILLDKELALITVPALRAGSDERIPNIIEMPFLVVGDLSSIIDLMEAFPPEYDDIRTGLEYKEVKQSDPFYAPVLAG